MLRSASYFAFKEAASGTWLILSSVGKHMAVRVGVRVRVRVRVSLGSWVALFCDWYSDKGLG